MFRRILYALNRTQRHWSRVHDVTVGELWSRIGDAADHPTRTLQILLANANAMVSFAVGPLGRSLLRKRVKLKKLTEMHICDIYTMLLSYGAVTLPDDVVGDRGAQEHMLRRVLERPHRVREFETLLRRQGQVQDLAERVAEMLVRALDIYDPTPAVLEQLTHRLLALSERCAGDLRALPAQEAPAED